MLQLYQLRVHETCLLQETDILDDDEDDEEYDEDELPEPHPNIRFALTSRQNLESAEEEDVVLDLKSVFVWQALIEVRC